MNLLELENLLTKHNIDINKYDRPDLGSKSIRDLHKELKEGECVIYEKDGQLFREASVLAIAIINEQKVLIEMNQHFHKNDHYQQKAKDRKRYYEVAEKIKGDELLDNAILRALSEELGLENVKYEILNEDKCFSNVRYSGTYPDLKSIYYIIFIPIKIVSYEANYNLFAESFDFTEKFANGEPRLTTSWKWVNFIELEKLNYQLFRNLDLIKAKL